jgi:hypothetical protein
VNWRWMAGLFLFGLGVSLLVAGLEDAPGYMDADYYFAGGMRLATGQGWTEPFLWNYLDESSALPHPGFTYWMPLASLIAAAGMQLFSLTSFKFAQIGPVILSALLPPLTAWLAYSLTQQRRAALLAGIFAGFSGFYLPFLVTTDTFSVCMILGIVWLQLLNAQHEAMIYSSRFFLLALGLGLTTGLLHLARADGLVWLVITLAAMAFETRRRIVSQGSGGAGRFQFGSLGKLGAALLICLSGYLLIMGGWFARNLALFGTLFPPAGGKVFWITTYNEIYAYPASILTPLRWLSSGLGEILQARLWALGQNLQTVLAVQGEIFLALLILPGLWVYRKDVRVRWGLLAFAMFFLLMTLVFPYPGGRGGLFHSGATLQPLFWALAPAGLETWLRFGERKRGWQVNTARKAFTTGLVALALLLTCLTTYTRLVGSGPAASAWGRSQARYRTLEGGLGALGAQPGQIALVNNPPGYYAATGREAIPVPDGDLAQTLAAARSFRASYLLLEPNHPTGLGSLYVNPTDQPGLRYLTTVDSTHVFEFVEER